MEKSFLHRFIAKQFNNLKAAEVEILCEDHWGGFVADVLASNGQLWRIRYEAARWTTGTWTTPPEKVPESCTRELL